MSPFSLDASQRLRALITVMISGGVVGLSLGLTIPLISLAMEHRGYSGFVIGLNTTFSSLAILLAGPFYPTVIRRIGPLSAMFGGILFSALIVSLFAVTETLWVWFLLRFLIGLTNGLYWVVSETWINAMAEDQSRGRVVGIYTTIFSIGLASGPMALSVVGSHGTLPFVISGGIMACSALPLLAARGMGPIIGPGQSPKLVRSIIRLAPVAIGGAFTCGFMHTTVFSLFPVYGLRSGFNTTDAVMLITIFAAGNFLFQPLLGWLADLIDTGSLIILTTAATVISVPLIPLCLDRPILIWPLIFVWGGVIDGLYTLGMIRLGHRFGRKDLAAASTMLVMAYTAGMVVGPSVSGAAMDALNPNGLIVALGCPAILYFLLAIKKRAAKPVVIVE